MILIKRKQESDSNRLPDRSKGNSYLMPIRRQKDASVICFRRRRVHIRRRQEYTRRCRIYARRRRKQITLNENKKNIGLHS